MSPVTKTLLIIMGSIVGIFLVPAVLIIFHDYIYAFIFITSVLASFILFGYYSYEEFYPKINREYLEEEEIFHQFHGDKEKIRFYKGFKKYFEGSLDKDGLEKWFENHPRKR